MSEYNKEKCYCKEPIFNPHNKSVAKIQGLGSGISGYFMNKLASYQSYHGTGYLLDDIFKSMLLGGYIGAIVGGCMYKHPTINACSVGDGCIFGAALGFVYPLTFPILAIRYYRGDLIRL